MPIDPWSVPQMIVCGECRDVVGRFRPLSGGSPLVQRGTCPVHRAPPDEPRWPRFDYNRQFELCRCCATVVLRSGSRWSVWFCEECEDQVGLLNARSGRCVVPIGRHSVHAGWLLPAERLRDAVVVESFLTAINGVSDARALLARWQREAVGRNLVAIRRASRDLVPVTEYVDGVRRVVDPTDRFRDMCAWLQECAAAARPGG
jgi:hypothetical protein